MMYIYTCVGKMHT